MSKIGEIVCCRLNHEYEGNKVSADEVEVVSFCPTNGYSIKDDNGNFYINIGYEI